MNGARRVVEAIRREGITTVFGYPGGAIMPLYDALAGSPVRHVLVRHEQAAAHAAEGWARASGRVGICLATSGPGATNLVTGLADALLDSIPIVAITGQVPTPLIGTDAFQEVDAFGLTMSVVKHSFLVRRPEELDRALRLAFQIAAEGRPGPVHVDLPKDVMLAECPEAEEPPGPDQPAAVDPEALERAAALVSAARRPLLYGGGGIHQARAGTAFRALAEKLNAPAVLTLKGLGALPSDHPLLLGMLGMHGARLANDALGQCDLLLAVGVRFDDRATGRLDRFCPDARVVHLDVDPAEVGKLRRPDAALVGCLSRTLPALADRLPSGPGWSPGAKDPRPGWPGEGICPRDLLEAIEADVVTTDVGQHQMWAAQFLRLHEGVTLVTSGGLGTMGFGLPAAIGAQLARPEARVVCVTGDGSLMMMIQELATLARYRLPVKILLFDNRCLGLVRQWQQLFFDNRESEIDLSDNPDFVALARVFGIPGRRIDRNAQVGEGVAEALASPGPYLLHCAIERETNVWPIVPSGRSNQEMLHEELAPAAVEP